MTDTRCDMTHRAYEFALGEGLGFWERSATVAPLSAVTPSRSGLRSLVGGRRRQGPGELMLHTFDGGLVVERKAGRVLGACYSAITAGLLDIDPCGASTQSSLALSLTFDGSRKLLLMETMTNADLLTELASRCHSSTRSRVEHGPIAQAFSDPDWI